MKTKKYKILVLSDLKKSTSTVLKSTISLAKMVHGDIQFFHVKKPTEIVQKESQLSAIRTINSDFKKTEKKIQKVLQPIIEEYHTSINYSFAFGNVKEEILSYITDYQPDIIVLGKRNPKVLNLGNNITEHILKTFEGVILIASNKNAIEPNKTLSLGFLNNFKEVFNFDFAKTLLNHAEKPIKSFKIINHTNSLKEPKKELQDLKTVDFEFESSDNVFKNISNYLLKSEVNLLCLNRDEQSLKNTNSLDTNINNIINKINVSILLTSKQNQLHQNQNEDLK